MGFLAFDVLANTWIVRGLLCPTSVILVDVMFLITDSICISLRTTEAEHCFTWVLAIWISSLKKYLFKSSVYFPSEWSSFSCQFVKVIYTFWVQITYPMEALQMTSSVL